MISTKNIKEERVDENEVIEASKQMQKMGTNAEIVGKRTALGDLQNRGVVRPVAKKEPSQSNLDNAKLQNVCKAVKARVDSHWKKPPAASNNASKAAAKKLNGETAAVPVTSAAVAQRKMITRSNSLRLATTNGTKVVGLQRHQSADVPTVAEKAKTLTNKVVENKIQIAQKTKAEMKSIKSEFEEKVVIESTLEDEEDKLLPKAELVAIQTDSNPILVKQECLATVDKEKIKESKSYSSGLLDGVNNIDEDDGDNLLLVSEYVNDIYDYLFQLESEQPIVKNHLEGQVEVNVNMRAVLIDWINEVHLQFRLIPETFQMAVAIIDRYLQAVTDTKRSQLQLVGVTGLFIAAKYEELFPPPITDFVYITDESYTDSEIRKMELKMIKTLDCNLSRPLPIHFLRRFSKAAEAEDIQYAMSKYFIELAMIESNMAYYKPSEIAASSLFLSLNLLKGNAKLTVGLDDIYWTPTLQWYSRYCVEHIKPIARKIAAIARNARTVKLKAVYNKYKSAKFQRISMRPELYGVLIDSIIKNGN
uniref:Uncharacterized protein n=1 Tax=Glossina palpalis gambiensis TaxID=67801 RepID=A0A1B0BN71_9MUSC